MTWENIDGAHLRKCHMRVTAFLDGQKYRAQMYTCTEYPELTKEVCFRRNTKENKPEVRWFCRGGELDLPELAGEAFYQALADAVNRHRSALEVGL